MAQPQLRRLSRKEFADTVRETYSQETTGLSDDEVIEVALQEDPSTQDVLETPEESLFRDSGAPAPPPLGAPRPKQIPNPQDVAMTGMEEMDMNLLHVPKGLQPAARAVAAPLRGFSQGVKQGMTAGALKPEVKSTDSQVAQLLGNVVGGGAVTMGAAAVGGVPALALTGLAQGATMASRTNLDQLEAQRLADAAKADQAGTPYTFKEPSLTDTLTTKGVSRVAGQAGANVLINMMPPLVRQSKLGSILTNALVGGAISPAPVAIDQWIDQGKLDPSDPNYKNAYRLSFGMGLGGGAVAGSLAERAPRASTAEHVPGNDNPDLYYDVPGAKPNDPTGGPKGARYYGKPTGQEGAEGWITVGDSITVNGQRVRQMRHVDNGAGGKMIEVRDDQGNISQHMGPTEFINQAQMRRIVIDPNKPPRSGQASGTTNSQWYADGPVDQADYNKPFGPPEQLKVGDGGKDVIGLADDPNQPPPGFVPPEDPLTPAEPVKPAAGFTPEIAAQKMREYTTETNVLPEDVDFRLGMGDRLKESMRRRGIEPSPEVVEPLNQPKPDDGDNTPQAMAPAGEGGGGGSQAGFGNLDLVTHVAASTAGGLLGGLQGDGDDKFNWSMALIGAGIGLGASTTLRGYFKKIGKEREIINGLSTHPSINEAFRRSAPGSHIAGDVKGALKSAYEVILDDTFTPHALLKREGEDWAAKNLGKADPAYFDHAINVLDQLTMTKFTIPPAIAEQFRTEFADVLKDDNSYERLLRITRLRADVEQRQNDLARRNEAFSWLGQYKAAKAVGDWDTMRFYRAKLRANPGILQPLPTMMRGNVPPDHAIATLNALEKEAAAKHPDVLRAADNWKQWGQQLANDLEKSGVPLSDETRRVTNNYSPNIDLGKSGKSGKISVGGPVGIGKSRSGFMKRRDRGKVDQKLWMDIVGPYFKRSMDQAVDLAKLDAAKSILSHYDPYKNGSLPPDQSANAPKGDYSPWSYSIPGEGGVEHGKEWGWLPTPVAAEIQKHYAPANEFQKFMDRVNGPLKGYLIRASGGSFPLNNLAGNVADMYYSTPVTQWPSLTAAGLHAIAATMLEGSSETLKRHGVSLGPKLQKIADVSEQGRKAGIGTEAAAAEITSQALADPRIAEKAIDPETPSRIRAARAVTAPLRAWGRGFDRIRQAGENTTRLAQFIHLVSNNGLEPKQAGRIVNMVQGNYNPTNTTTRERDLKRFVLFETFYKNAFPNWLPLIGREIAYGDEIHGGRGASRLKTAAPMAKKLAAVTAVGLAANLWNHLFFPDAEASLTDYQKDQFHLIMPDVMGKGGVWNNERDEWNLAYHGWPTPGNIIAHSVGLGGIENRAIHDLRGTGAQSIGEEVDRSWDQVKQFWGGLMHPVVGVIGGLMTGKDPVTGQPVVEPGATNWQAALQVAQYPFRGLPGTRQMYQAARDAAEPNETAANFVRRMLVGSLYQPLNRQNQETRALARATSSGINAANTKGDAAREAALFRGEQQEWTPEEINSILTGQDKVTWKGKAMRLAELPKFMEKMGGIKPSDEGAVEALAKAGKASTIDVRKSGPVFLPTRDYIRALGPDAALKTFIETYQGGNQREAAAWRSGMVSIVRQLRNESKNWEIPASLMMMLHQSPEGEANSDILRRVHGLEDAFDPSIQRGDQLGRKIFGK